MKNKRLIVVIIVLSMIITAIFGYVNIAKNNNKAGTEIAAGKEEIKAIIDEEVDTSNWDLNKVKIEYDTENVPVPVPIGFTASKAEGEHTVNTGFVIYEGEVEAANPNEWTESEAWQASLDKNQFVWIPVTNPNRIYETNATTGKKKAKLWKLTSSSRNAIINGDNDSRMEPGILNDKQYEKVKYFVQNNLQEYTQDILYKELQNEFNRCIASIVKYGGFYIGRYETGNISTITPKITKMNTDISNQNWYNMYARTKNISNNINIQTGMIWGCLWDETLQWLVDTGMKTQAEVATDSSSWGNYRNSTFRYYNSNGELTNIKASTYANGTKIPTGSAEYTKVNNIYDLAGNVDEMTMEGKGSTERYSRGGSHGSRGNIDPADSRYNWYPSLPYGGGSSLGCRSYFYIK